MKRFLPLLLVFFVGCSAQDRDMEEALALRSRILAASNISMEAEICADYITKVDEFSLECTWTGGADMAFRVLEPEEIADIQGTVNGTEGTVEYDGAVLAFPLLADGRLSVVSGPWVLMQALRSGYIVAVGREGDQLHLTIDDSYESNAMTVDIWLEEGKIEWAEIAWEGRRCLTMEVDDFTVSA